MGYAAGHPETTRLLLNWDDRLHVVICPRRASKSYSAMKKALPLILGREALPDGSGPRPTKTWIVGSTYELAEREFRYAWNDIVKVGPTLGWPKPIISRDSSRGGDLQLVTAWGSSVSGKSADKPQSLLGEAVDLVVMAEAATMPADIWHRYLEPTLATTQGYAIFPTTPNAAALWLYEMWNRGIEGGHGVASYTWPVSGNPTYPLAELERARKYYGEEHPAFREQYLGEWTFYAGVVYGHDFRPERNVRPAFPIPAHWPRIRGIDFGYRDPFVCLWFAVAEDSMELKTQRGELLLYREYYQPGRSMAEHAETIRHLSRDERILMTVGDPSEQQSMADLRRLGIPCVNGNNDRRAGRALVGNYFREGKLTLIRGACPNTLRELNFYQWDRDKDKEGAKELTIGDDHAMDALRYVVMSRPQSRPKTAQRMKGTFQAHLQRSIRDRAAAMWPNG